ncbi:MAG: hypothetical protein R3C12_16700 [Planctomycetaceae bacterium]
MSMNTLPAGRPVLFCSMALLLLLTTVEVSAQALRYRDRQPQRYQISARASQLDPRAKEHPKSGLYSKPMANRKT